MKCPNGECGNVFECVSGAMFNECMKCKFKICVGCGVKWHQGMDCEEY